MYGPASRAPYVSTKRNSGAPPSTSSVTVSSRPRASTCRASGALSPHRPGLAITVFDSTGLAIRDAALDRVIHAAARSKGAGTALDFSA